MLQARALFDAALPLLGRPKRKDSEPRQQRWDRLTSIWMLDGGDAEIPQPDQKRLRAVAKEWRKDPAFKPAVDLVKNTPADQRDGLLATIRKLRTQDGRVELMQSFDDAPGAQPSSLEHDEEAGGSTPIGARIEESVLAANRHVAHAEVRFERGRCSSPCHQFSNSRLSACLLCALPGCKGAHDLRPRRYRRPRA